MMMPGVQDKLSMSLDEISKANRQQSTSSEPSSSGPSRRQGRGKSQRQEPIAVKSAVKCFGCGGPHVRAMCPRKSQDLTSRGNMSCYACGGPHQKALCPHKGKTCDNCGEVGHLKSTCRKDPVCFGCGSSDHRKSACPHANKTCDICGKVGHLKATCRLSNQQGQALSCYACAGNHKKADCPHKDKTCNSCGEIGHLKATCRKPAGDLATQKKQGQSGIFGNVVERPCFRCGTTGHEGMNCPHKETTCNNCGKLGHLKLTCRQIAAN